MHRSQIISQLHSSQSNHSTKQTPPSRTNLKALIFTVHPSSQASSPLVRKLHPPARLHRLRRPRRQPANRSPASSSSGSNFPGEPIPGIFIISSQASLSSAGIFPTNGSPASSSQNQPDVSDDHVSDDHVSDDHRPRRLHQIVPASFEPIPSFILIAGHLRSSSSTGVPIVVGIPNREELRFRKHRFRINRKKSPENHGVPFFGFLSKSEKIEALGVYKKDRRVFVRGGGRSSFFPGAIRLFPVVVSAALVWEKEQSYALFFSFLNQWLGRKRLGLWY